MRKAILVADLGNGDAGKGSIVDYLTRQEQAHTVIRYNGGAQAAHHVVTSDGRAHCFAQFGSGTFVPGTATYLSRFMLINPLNMFNEEQHLQTVGVTDTFTRTFAHRNALVITPFHIAMNRLRERIRESYGLLHGSCGAGVGETRQDALAEYEDVIRIGDLQNPQLLEKKLKGIQKRKWQEVQLLTYQEEINEGVAREMGVLQSEDVIQHCIHLYLRLAGRISIVDDAWETELLHKSGTVIFEGAQGVLLDETYGFAPFHTWSNTTYENALTMLHNSSYAGQVERLGITRAYATRHGAGPFVTEDKSLDYLLPEPHNGTNEWQREFRVGHLDMMMLRYAVGVVGGIDSLAVTHLDRLQHLPQWRVAVEYRLGRRRTGWSPFFLPGMERYTLSDIRLKIPGDLDHQTELTQFLQVCSPLYTRLETGDTEGFLGFLERELDATVTIRSYGMTAADKRSHAMVA